RPRDGDVAAACGDDAGGCRSRLRRRRRHHGECQAKMTELALASTFDVVPAPPRVSVVIPVYNEEAGLPALFARLYPALEKLGVEYEVNFVHDGSRHRPAAVLREQFQKRPDVTRVVLLNGNFGQHMAIMAGFER